ncbi:SMI1/KNR4 family protein [Periweissella cryptocerci]|uniref:SMI1/KNR4 family protein n=1 Tax=Periweissella cryptocerci TaxID=2506420 RepID=A0A4V1AIJ5_9LACO|nr:SMI1/KNR4 family protein [Periweissella cryptocerci]QBO35725.1 SMI1/KNR4 family protein [Periweissella cryptocerci]
MYDDKSIMFPLPSQDLITKEEGCWSVVLPDDYKKFITAYNGVTPISNEFTVNAREYLIEKFLPILETPEDNELGEYDIDVVLTELDERLISDEDLVGVELLPIAALFSGDFLVLDYSSRKQNPSLAIWLHDESSEWEPVKIPAFETFSELLNNLH